MVASNASDIQSDWDVPELRWYSRLAQNRTLVSYDRRGGGASDADVTDVSLDALVGDLEAVVHWSALDRFALLGPFHAGLVAIAYAARHPERVTHLILFQAYANGGEFQALPKIQAARALLAKDFRAHVETSLFFDDGWVRPDVAQSSAERFQAKTSRDRLLNEFAHLDRTDVTDLLPLIEAPTLVLHRRRAPYPPLEFARVLASAIPDAQLVLLDGEAAVAWDTDGEETCQAIERFTEQEVEPASPREDRPSAGLTEREIDVLRLVVQGQSNKEIAADLSLSVHTVERHLANVYAKIGARGRTDAVAFAHDNHLV